MITILKSRRFYPSLNSYKYKKINQKWVLKLLQQRAFKFYIKTVHLVQSHKLLFYV